VGYTLAEKWITNKRTGVRRTKLTVAKPHTQNGLVDGTQNAKMPSRSSACWKERIRATRLTREWMAVARDRLAIRGVGTLNTSYCRPSSGVIHESPQALNTTNTNTNDKMTIDKLLA
jgi:hypothetical protein